ncbi:HNH endonuclease [Parabacteroides sp. OttesenSCG-928-B22]|nr:HNH endonuclease [Parabacteroides sp. OttesenSCG-928-B22]
MKNILIILLVLLACVSCNKEEQENLPLFDFGKSEYEQPFVGLLKSEPSFLVKSLQYPPFKWLAPDTLMLEKSFVVDFNEEALRSKSQATISFVDSLYQPFEGLEFFCNGSSFVNNRYVINADSLTKILNIQCKVHPRFNEQTANGFLLIHGEELDISNAIPLQQEYNVIADWQCEQKIGWPVTLWLLWLLCVLIVAIIIVCLLYIISIKLFESIKFIIKSISEINKKDYSRGAPIGSDGKGYWIKDIGNSIYVFEPESKPPEANYGNPKDQTYSEMGRDIGDPMPQVRFKRGYPVFDRDPATPDGRPLNIKIKNGIIQYIDIDEVIKTNGAKTNREKLHIKLFELIGKKYGMTPEEVRVFKGDSAVVPVLAKQWGCSENEVWIRCNNPHQIQRVFHEVEDGKTVQLVPRLYHNNVTHKGGIEKVVKKILYKHLNKR